VPFRPIVVLKGERQRAAYAELWRFLCGKPVRSRPWRDFWKVWLAGFTPTFIAMTALDTGPFTLLGLALLAGGMVLTLVLGVVFRRYRVIADYRRAD
jgi:hypothetical protein